MKVLWFSITPSHYCLERDSHNGGGWIEGLEDIVTYYNKIQLGIAFVTNNPKATISYKNGVTYYPIYIHRNMIKKISDKFSYKSYDLSAIQEYLKVVDDYKPDLIHIFGSEWNFGLIKNYIDIPIVIHIQGFWPEYRNSAYPPGFSEREYILEKWYKPQSIVNRLLIENLSKQRAKREERILRINDNYMGRTRWDKAITHFYNPNSSYYYCSEALRDTFIEEKQKWINKNTTKFSIVTVGAGHSLKGYDLVLKTCKLLKENTDMVFDWILCGPTCKDIKKFERIIHIKSKNVNVVPKGKCSAVQLKKILLDSSLYIHPSYIDNSPNSVCEAQYLGLPIIATNVGGTQSLFSSDYPSDMLVPTNDPYYLASKIVELYRNSKKATIMSDLNYKIARNRHSINCIYNDLLKAYNNILLKNNGNNN